MLPKGQSLKVFQFPKKKQFTSNLPVKQTNSPTPNAQIAFRKIFFLKSKIHQKQPKKNHL